MQSRRKLLAAGGALILAAIVAGAAFAATGHVASFRAVEQPSARRLASARGSLISVAAAYLGTSTASLRRELKAGQTLAQVANATSGRSETGLDRVLLANTESRLGQVAGAMTRTKVRFVHVWLRRTVAGYVRGTCPLQFHTLFHRLGGTCAGMHM